MDPIRENILAAFNFTKREKRGLFVLILLILLIWIFPKVVYFFHPQDEEIIFQQSYIEFESQLLKNEVESDPQSGKVKIEYFDFDPNEISSYQMRQMGFPDFLIERIEKYRRAGGAFRIKEDLKKIYGMKPQFYSELEPYISIKEQKIIKTTPSSALHQFADLNKADSATFESLKAIGPISAKRIVNYRMALGGYTSKEQLKEVYGITEEAYTAICNQTYIDNTFEPERIKINAISAIELRKHPYFRNYNLSNSIINYRNLHGAFKSADDLGEVKLLNDSILGKILPYLDFHGLPE